MATYKRWNDTELEFIKNNLPLFSDHELAAKLSEMTGENITYGMVRRQRRKLNIVKKRGRPSKNKNVVKSDLDS